MKGLIERAVAAALDTPKNTAVCLSGGIDSSTVATIANQIKPGIPMFTGYYAHEPDFDERSYARLVEGKHIWVQITPWDFVYSFDEVSRILHPPWPGPGAVGQYIVARAMGSHDIELVLTGEGGDELFGGYARLHLVAKVKPPDGFEDYKLPDGYPRGLRAALAYELDGLTDLCAMDANINGAWGIEVRPPLCNPAVVAHVAQHPAKDRVGKTLLRKAMQGVVPDPILQRTDKKGFPVPFVKWAQQEPMRSFIQERIGYIPDPSKPWDRGWWNDLLDASLAAHHL